jgi:protein TonB
MFEDSLEESRNRLASKSRRWITVGSTVVQCLMAGAIVLWPLVRPGALSFQGMMAPVVVAPVVKRPPVRVERQAAASPASLAAPLNPPVLRLGGRRAILPTMAPVEEEVSEVRPGALRMAGTGGSGIDPLGLDVGTETRVTVAAPRRNEAMRLSAGVMAGRLLGEIRPVYPRIAMAARVEGRVVIEATISTAGTIESARVVSGPGMLAGAALDAVKGARYLPYRLNGEATEVQTTVTVIFRLGS